MNRVTNQTYPSGQTINFTYNAQGELNSIPNILTDLTYNALGKVTLKEFGGARFTVLKYHSDDFRLGRIFTSGSGSLQDLNYTFDNVGNILSIVDALNSTTQSFTYDDLDRISTASETSGYTRAYTYNSIGNILSVNESGTVQNYTYGENSAGPHALTNYTDTVTSCGCTGSQPPASGDWDIDEDTSCSGSDIDVSGGLNINNGNTLTLSEGTLYLDGDILLDGDITLGSDIDFGGSGGSCSSSSVTYNLTYDENGNVIEGFGFYFDYNNANQLWRVRNSSGTVAEYFYDSNGQRFKKNESGTVTYYVGEHYEVVSYSNGSVVNTSYYFANGERVAKKVVSSGDPIGSTYYYHPDHLGSTNVISNSSGGLVETTKYFPFGETRAGGAENKYLFNSKEYEADIGVYYYGARYYAPEVRRWVQADPILQNLYDPQSLNRYSYVRNNPVKYLDPSGNQYMLPGIEQFLYPTTTAVVTGATYVGAAIGTSVGFMVVAPFLMAPTVYAMAENEYFEYMTSQVYHGVSVSHHQNKIWLLGHWYRGPTDPKKLPRDKETSDDDWGPTNYELEGGKDYKVDTMDEAAKLAREKSGMPRSGMEPEVNVNPNAKQSQHLFWDEEGGIHYRSWVGRKGTIYEGGEFRLDSGNTGQGPNWQHFNYKSPFTGEKGHIFFKTANEEAFYAHL